jgi:thymidylate synthase (FAD)
MLKYGIIEVVDFVPVEVAVLGARTCWDSIDKCDNGPKDIELLNRIGNKFKHRSVMEHMRLTFTLRWLNGCANATLSKEDANHLIEVLSNNPYVTKTTPSEHESTTISFNTNLRALLEDSKIDDDILHSIIPKDYSVFINDRFYEDGEDKVIENDRNAKDIINELSKLRLTPYDNISVKLLHMNNVADIYSFRVTNISRALLQEFARHRTFSPSVKSTRYTLKELKNEEPFTYLNGRDNLYKRASKYIKISDVGNINVVNIRTLEAMRQMVSKLPNDKTKYALPESYLTDLVFTADSRGLFNMLGLRLAKDALLEFRTLSILIMKAIFDAGTDIEDLNNMVLKNDFEDYKEKMLHKI